MRLYEPNAVFTVTGGFYDHPSSARFEVQERYSSLQKALDRAIDLRDTEPVPEHHGVLFVDRQRRGASRDAHLTLRARGGSWGLESASAEAGALLGERMYGGPVRAATQAAEPLTGFDFFPNRRRYTVNRADVEAAKKIREDFHDKPSTRQYEVEWKWPRTVTYLGTCEAVMYSSNKWEKNPKSFHDYKHVAEGPQHVFVSPSFELRGVEAAGPTVRVENMPASFAVLDKILGVQVQPESTPERYFQIDIPRCMLGASRSRDGRHTFLIVYSTGADGECHMIITGDKLAVTKDGIVG